MTSRNRRYLFSCMSYNATTSPLFLAPLEQWLKSQGEILVLIRYAYAGGSKSFEFFSSFEALSERLKSLPAQTSVIVFRQPQLLLRGTVDDAFIEACLDYLPDGSEYLVTELTPRVYGRVSWLHYGDGESHSELREELEDLRGISVAAGLYPPWLVDTDDVISALVPDEHGVVKPGAY